MRRSMSIPLFQPCRWRSLLPDRTIWRTSAIGCRRRVWPPSATVSPSWIISAASSRLTSFVWLGTIASLPLSPVQDHPEDASGLGEQEAERLRRLRRREAVGDERRDVEAPLPEEGHRVPVVVEVEASREHDRGPPQVEGMVIQHEGVRKVALEAEPPLPAEEADPLGHERGVPHSIDDHVGPSVHLAPPPRLVDRRGGSPGSVPPGVPPGEALPPHHVGQGVDRGVDRDIGAPAPGQRHAPLEDVGGDPPPPRARQSWAAIWPIMPWPTTTTRSPSRTPVSRTPLRLTAARPARAASSALTSGGSR